MTTSHQDLSPFERVPDKHYVVRTVAPLEPFLRLLNVAFLQTRGPFDVAAEGALMDRHGIEVLVTKNSGGEASRAKLDAARRRGVPVVMVERSTGPEDAPLLHEPAAQPSAAVTPGTTRTGIPARRGPEPPRLPSRRRRNPRLEADHILPFLGALDHEGVEFPLPVLVPGSGLAHVDALHLRIGPVQDLERNHPIMEENSAFSSAHTACRVSSPG